MGQKTNALEGILEKRYLLVLLVYLLWNEKIAFELSFSHVHLGKRLYKEVLEELKKKFSAWEKEGGARFDELNLICQELGHLYFLEKRLEKIEHKLKESNETIPHGLPDCRGPHPFIKFSTMLTPPPLLLLLLIHNRGFFFNNTSCNLLNHLQNTQIMCKKFYFAH